MLKNKLLNLAEKNNGILFTSEVTEQGYSRSTLQSLVNEEKLFKIQRGIYATENGYVDDFFLLQQRYPKGIYSHETALYLLDYSDRVPEKFTMTFPQGVSSARMQTDNIRPVMISRFLNLGKVKIEKTEGFPIQVYEIERTLVDLMRGRYDPDLEQFNPALKQYANSATKDLNKLFRYARTFGVENKLRTRMEVLL